MGWDLGMSNELWGWQLGPFYLDHWMSWILAKMASEKRVTVGGQEKGKSDFGMKKKIMKWSNLTGARQK